MDSKSRKISGESIRPYNTSMESGMEVLRIRKDCTSRVPVLCDAC